MPLARFTATERANRWLSVLIPFGLVEIFRGAARPVRIAAAGIDAARRLGITRVTLRAKIRRYGLA